MNEGGNEGKEETDEEGGWERGRANLRRFSSS